MELKDTAKSMNSHDYKERFRAEYYQTKIRYEKLNSLVVKMEASQAKNSDYSKFCGFEPTCPKSLLSEQCASMGNYLHILEIRAVIEDIAL